MRNKNIGEQPIPVRQSSQGRALLQKKKKDESHFNHFSHFCFKYKLKIHFFFVKQWKFERWIPRFEELKIDDPSDWNEISRDYLINTVISKKHYLCNRLLKSTGRGRSSLP